MHTYIVIALHSCTNSILTFSPGSISDIEAVRYNQVPFIIQLKNCKISTIALTIIVHPVFLVQWSHLKFPPNMDLEWNYERICRID